MQFPSRAALVAAVLATGLATGLGASLFSADRVAVLPATRTHTATMQRKVNRLRHRLSDPIRTGTREMARRVRQIGAGQLRAENGLARAG